jgi:outer membrane lipoprotein-sorting protein
MTLFGRLASLLAAAPLLQAADNMDAVFARMDAAARTFKGMAADVQETVHSAIDDDNYVSDGTIKLRRAKSGDVRFLIEFRTPDPRAAAFAGSEMHVYNPKTNQELIYDVSAKKAMIEQAMLLGFGAASDEIKASYDATYVAPDTVDGQPAAHIRLIPKTKEMRAQVSQADLWISNSLGVPIQEKFLTTAAGNFNLFKFSHLKMASGLSDKDLQLNTPKGVQKKRVGS